MHCANCGQWVELGPHDELRFLERERDAEYLILAVRRYRARPVHKCTLRPAKVHQR